MSADPVPGPDSDPSVPAIRPNALLIRALLLLLIAVAGAMAYRFTPLKEWLQPAGSVAGWIRAQGLLGAMVFVVTMTGLIFAGVPRLLFCPIAGALFGFWVGLGLTTLATMISYYTAFLVIRGRGRTMPAKPIHPRLAFLSRDPGLAGVIISRNVPVPGMLVTLMLSLSTVRHPVYLLGSFIGLIPEAAPLVLLGAGLIESSSNHFAAWIGIALVCVLIAWMAIRQAAKRFSHGNSRDTSS